MDGIIFCVSVFIAILYWIKSSDYSNLKRKYTEIDNDNTKWRKSFATVSHYEKEQKALADKIVENAKITLNNAHKTSDNIVKTANINAQSIINKANEQYYISVQKSTIIEEVLKTKISQFPLIATILADVQTSYEENIAKQLEMKRNPARNGAAEVRRIKAEKRNLIAENKAYKWELNYLRNLIPWIEELEDDIIEPKQDYMNYDNSSVSNDNATFYLSPDEYNNLTTVEKYQLALDRYKKRNKSNAEIGKDYERYIGYKFECEGFLVEYYGIEKSIEDLGRDLICKKENKIYIVQCKCWSNKQNKCIHEKHINQLYGTAMKYYLDYKRKLPTSRKSDVVFGKHSENLFATVIIPIFFSTVPYTDTAIEFAETLEIETRVEVLNDYPCIKCNINNKGERIYHLPFDQQYDKCQIKNKGEFFAMTVAEAEAAGFRRAMRWSGNNNKNN